MKNYLFILIAYFAIILLSCDEDEPVNKKNSHRIKEYIETYENNSYKAEFNYIDEKLIAVNEYNLSDSGTWENYRKSEIEYANGNTTMLEYYFDLENWVLNYKLDFIFDDELVKELTTWDYEDQSYIGEEKIKYIYSGDKCEMAEYYYMNDNYQWEIYHKEILNYTDGKISEYLGFSSEYTDDWYQTDKETFSYTDGKLISYTEFFNFQDTWKEGFKCIYDYSSDLIIQANYFYFNDTEWIADETESYTYNENDYLIEKNDDDKQTVYTYEEGHGNVSLFIKDQISERYKEPGIKNSPVEFKYVSFIEKVKNNFIKKH
ncbi:MAG: hypothetical protein A2X13_08760 [Bacteroidetes bacterium GWC2_33_15]|nr:MAG: hypothetical protein A2X10_14655 [Bacteroidetes bacterium GWA2_33_15]OFX51343.1 MAG: hypothetical protein A2X13_08760 [Bacteroidetes bacterium GWC2_33_15]OFX65122.1 MAG: hypothetical protein A2X15_06925 [Bacteroidetes bacterium GWB2_32_14]OFX70719.1 MAG: hypothetical protein A2X14_11135 [Bacteroidetes bacterium GWD2_33_33]HAN18484.1 hypothetical protein [Bacteroidales bacterium]